MFAGLRKLFSKKKTQTALPPTEPVVETKTETPAIAESKPEESKTEEREQKKCWNCAAPNDKFVTKCWLCKKAI
ncbi:MAG: hypothetical protein NT120_04425 [Candidatus Aenigmarchaeota archaeon]|nr:hypothetical protein [Candidatus Aenigmarchaeota archaeon]